MERRINFTFSWVLDKKLGGMAKPSEYDLAALCHSDLNVGAIITLLENPLAFKMNEIVPEYSKKVSQGEAPKLYHIPIVDFSIPTIEQVEEFISLYKQVTSKGKSVVVHCAGGRGRTGTMLACAIVVEKELSGRKAIEFVRENRPGSIETKEQEKFVEKFAEYWFQKQIRI